MVFNKKKVFFSAVLICLVAAALVWVRSYTFSRLAADINRRIDSLKVSGLTITYDSLSVDWRKNIIQINGFLLEKNPYDTTCIRPEYIKASTVRVVGLRLFPLIFSNVLSFEKLFLVHPHLVVRQASLFNLDSAARKKNPFSLRVNEIYVQSAEIEYIDSAGCENIVHVRSNVEIRKLKMDLHDPTPLMYELGSVTLDTAEVRLKGHPYTYVIQSARFDVGRQALRADTIRLLPDFEKFEYGRRRGYEADRVEGLMPYLYAEGVLFSFADSSYIQAKLAKTQFYLKVFRDKRLPFRKTAKLLPTAFLRKLPLKVVVDTLKIIKSFVQYEEFPADGAEAGKVYFYDLEAVFCGIDNRSPNAEIKLNAEGLLMGEGKVTLSAIFPLDEKRRSRLTGSLKNFTLSKINSMLIPSAHIKVESGRMKKFSFNFSHDAVNSSGEIILNYRDLKLVMFKEQEKSDGEGLDKDNLQTFIINTFVFRKNMDSSLPEDIRTGKINYTRDASRSIFNFWLKSVLSGVKSAYNLDKAEAKKSKREIKKEERLARREARKLKKMAKNKERNKDRG